jgi:hypothetical protein
MPNRLWLPTGSKPFPFATDDERELLINRLWELRYAVPTARQMELSKLRDYVAYAEKRVADDEEAAKKEEAEARDKMKGMSQEQVLGAMKEFLNWRNKKQGREGQYDLNKKN